MVALLQSVPVLRPLALVLMVTILGAGAARAQKRPSVPSTPAAGAQQQNPLVGTWRQSGWKPCKPLAVLKPENVDWNLEELEFKADGTYTVTWQPFETYKDYWGHYSYSVAEHGYTLAPDVVPAGPQTDPRIYGPWSRGPIELVIERGNYVPRDFSGKGIFAIRGKQLTLTYVKLGTRHATEPLDLCELTFLKY